MIRADCAFRMGRSHLVCQDYAVARSGEQAVALLADGCSSSPDTDVGARLLTLAALPLASCLMEQDKRDTTDADDKDTFAALLDKYHHDAITEARRYVERLELPGEALDATLLTVAASEGRWFASVFGDGVVAAARHDGSLDVTVVSYLGGYPYYANYLADAERARALLKIRGNLRQIETFTLLPDGAIADMRRDTCRTDAPCAYVAGSTREYRFVAALSDGVHSFGQANAEQTGNMGANTPVALRDVLRGLTAFKTMTGQFAQRRMQKFEQTCALSGWQHHDDISLAVLAFA